MLLELKFGDDDRSRERFRQIYNGLVTGSLLAAQQRDDRNKPLRSIEDVEREAEIHEALEGISAEADDMTGTGEPMRELTGEAVVTFKQPVMATLKKYLELFIASPACRSTASRHAVDALHFVRKADEAGK